MMLIVWIPRFWFQLLICCMSDLKTELVAACIVDHAVLLQVEDEVAVENKKNEQNSEDANKELDAKIENEAKPVIANDKIELKYKYREGKFFG